MNISGSGGTARDTLFGAIKVMAAIPLAVLVLVPDAEMHAKTFKLGLILKNLGRQVFGA